jgi:hypothetical protein
MWSHRGTIAQWQSWNRSGLVRVFGAGFPQVVAYGLDTGARGDAVTAIQDYHSRNDRLVFVCRSFRQRLRYEGGRAYASRGSPPIILTLLGSLEGGFVFSTGGGSWVVPLQFVCRQAGYRPLHIAPLLVGVS